MTQSVVTYVREHDGCSSNEVIEGFARADGLAKLPLAHLRAVHEALNALVTSGVLFGQRDDAYEGWQQDHDREWDTRWEHLTFRG